MHPETTTSDPRTWSPHPQAGEFRFDAAELTQRWELLHVCDAEPLPSDPAVLLAWVHFHNGEFQQAAEAGLAAGGAGVTVANRATGVHATYLEKDAKRRLERFLELAERALAQSRVEPRNANAWYWQAYGLGRYSQGISVAKAVAQGLGGKIRHALEKAVELEPRHVNGHLALGIFHAEVIDKVGALIGGMTYGARKETGLRHFREGLRLHPTSVIGRVDYANGLVMLEGDRAVEEATRLYEQAAASQPHDAAERLEIELARSELDE